MSNRNFAIPDFYRSMGGGADSLGRLIRSTEVPAARRQVRVWGGHPCRRSSRVALQTSPQILHQQHPMQVVNRRLFKSKSRIESPCFRVNGMN